MDPRLYNLHRDEQQRVSNYFEPGMPVERLEERDDFGSWTILERGDDRWLMQHDNRAFMWVTVDGGRAVSFELVMGPAAIALEAQRRR
jgi:hypothetical protein